MKLKIWDIKKRRDPLEFHYTESLSDLAKELPQVIDIPTVTVSGSANEFAGLYKVKGKIETTLIMQCSKCLTQYTEKMNLPFEELFISDQVETNFDEADEEEENIHALENDEINLDAIVMEHVLINIPFVPVCHEACKGLCPVCGTNLNENSCGCKVEKIDPRLAELQKWFDQNDSKE